MMSFSHLDEIFVAFLIRKRLLQFSNLFGDLFFAGAGGLTKNISQVASADHVRSIEIGRATHIVSVTTQGELLLRGL